MFEAAAILFSAGIFIFNYLINKDVFYPPALFSLLWTAILIIYVIFVFANGSAPEYIIDPRCLFVFIAGQVVFCAGSFFATNPALKKQIKVTQPVIKYGFDKYIFAVLLVLLPLYIKSLINIVNSSTYATSSTDINFFIALRYEFTAEGVTLGILEYLVTFSLFGFAIAMYKFNYADKTEKQTKIDKLYRFFFYAIVIVYTVLSTGRTYLLVLLCLYIGFRRMKETFTRKTLIRSLLLVVLVFALYAFVLHKGGGEFFTLQQNLVNISNTLMEYILGGIYAFNTFIKASPPLDYGENSFRFFIALFHSAGLTDTEPKSVIMPFIYTPILSNVYSVYYVYIKDFWYFGIIILGFFGYLHTRFYYRAKRDFFNLYMYSVFLYPLIMSFFQDQYISLLSTWIQITFFACAALPFIEYKKKKEVTLQ